MSKVVYFDCFCGISGDMVLGALLDAGLPMSELERALGSLALDGCDVSAQKVLRAGISATKFRSGGSGTTAREHVHSHQEVHGRDHHRAEHRHMEHSAHEHTHRSLPEIFALVDRSALSSNGKARVQRMFTRLAEAEAAIHQMSVERVHLHEVGALDSIIDIVGAVFGMEWLNADRVASSPLNVGGGMVQSAHGHFPVPAPATLSLLRGVPMYSSGLDAELVTPTGALIVTEFATEFGSLPPMSVTAVGYGAGDWNPGHTPNVLRLLVGEAAEGVSVERVVLLSCEIDDMNPQIYGVLMDKLYAAGAVEVFFSPVQMKKNRPGTLVTVLSPPDRRATLEAIVFAETTTMASDTMKYRGHGSTGRS
jgi:uncharacterized protein (TIGR00299 family) protein